MHHPPTRTATIALACALALGQTTCLGLTEDRAERDLEVGEFQGDGLGLVVDDGLASIQAVEPGRVHLWAQAPVLDLRLSTSEEAVERWELTIDNCMPGAELVVVEGDAIAAEPLEPAYPAQCRFDLSLAPGTATVLRVAPADWDEAEPWRFAVLSDIQRAVDDVQDVFDRINADPTLRFVASSGDLTSNGTAEEIEAIQAAMRGLDIPIYSTTGNHELNGSGADPWHTMWGRYNFHFDFKGTGFSFADSSNASLAPSVYGWLDGWLADHDEGVHVFVTHIPPIDPVGTRNGAFRSRHEAGKLLNALAEGGVDLNVYGHLHTLFATEQAGIPTYVSGGGGAIQETMDGIERHFLAVDVDPTQGIREVGVVRID